MLLGKVTTDISRLTALPNVHLLGRKPFATLPGYSKGFDVAINPFPISEVTLNANPLKVREYLAAGLPVVSTRIPEVEVLGQCRIGDSPEGVHPRDRSGPGRARPAGRPQREHAPGKLGGPGRGGTPPRRRVQGQPAQLRATIRRIMRTAVLT